MKPYKFQNEGSLALTRALLSGQKGALLADEPGVGKTAQACMVANFLASRSICVISPAVAKINWQREMDMWSALGVHLEIPKTKDKGQLPNDIAINYDIIWRVPELQERKFDLVICDESHYLKNPKSKRGKAAKKICHNAKHVLMLSGTPIENRPVELFWQMVCMGWLDAKQYGWYVRRYCDYKKRRIFVKGRPRDIVDVSGSANLGELRSFMLEKHMVRRTKAQVLSQLPPKTNTIIEIPRKTQWRSALLQDAFAPASAPKVGQVKYFKSLREAAKTPADRQRLVDSIAKARRMDGIDKLGQSAQFVRDKLESGVEKTVVFAHHTEVIEGLMGELKEFKPVCIYGSVSAKKRQKAIDDFQDPDSGVRVFIGNYKAAGTAITLTAAHHVVLAELDWVPGVVSQASDRCHRNGQLGNVTVYYLVFEDSTDAVVVKSLVEKQEVLDCLLDGAEPPEGAMDMIDPLDILLGI